VQVRTDESGGVGCRWHRSRAGSLLQQQMVLRPQANRESQVTGTFASISSTAAADAFVLCSIKSTERLSSADSDSPSIRASVPKRCFVSSLTQVERWVLPCAMEL
jgi:hypothetical protein